MRLTLGQRLTMRVGAALGHIAPWHELPRPLGLLCLMGIRTRLRHQNLYDPAPPAGGGPAPATGAAGRPFGRNQPLWGIAAASPEELLHPSPREVSNRLLARNGATREVPFLNLLAAAWLQFMVHDWMSHGRGTPGDEIRIPLADGDRWAARSPGDEMLVRRSRPSAAQTSPTLPVFDNTETHWWDGSQLYGSTPERERMVREGAGGRLRIGADGLLPLEGTRGIDLAGVNGNWWVGLGILHTLFAREHNAVCAMLARHNPGWDDDRLFSVARRVTAAVMAKIHTIEWTTAIVPHPTVRAAMRGNWYGLFGPRAGRALRRVTRSDALTGIPGSRCDDHGVPFAITEEFVAVYRMHPLLPDEFVLFDGSGGQTRRTMLEMTGPAARAVMESHPLGDLLVSFGRGRPGLLALHNYPDTLRDLERSRGEGAGSEQRIDLAAIDIVRDRERGVPRYNDFRRMLRLPPAASFVELTGGDADAAAEIEEVYGDIERIDLMIGLYAEPLLAGFGFSETAFHIFILMASRRVKSDPFFTDDYRPEVYTPEGLRWVEEASMAGVIERHVPELGPTVRALPSAFAPWSQEAAA